MSAEKSKTSAAKLRSIELVIEPCAYPFKQQFFFNWFQVDQFEDGKIIKLANTASFEDSVAIILERDALMNMKHSCAQYLIGFPQTELSALPNYHCRPQSPLIANYTQLARRGRFAELAFYLMRLHDIGNLTKDKPKAEHKIGGIPVALMHSTIDIHYQLLIEILKEIPDISDIR